MLDNFNFQLVRPFNGILTALALSVVSMALPGDSFAEGEKYAVVDPSRLLATLAEARGLQDKMESEKERLKRQLSTMAEKIESLNDDLEKNKLKLSEIEVRRRERQILRGQSELQLAQRQLQEELDQREKEEVLILRSELSSLIKNYLKSQDFTIVFYTETLAGYKDTLDITDDVVRVIRKQTKE